MPVVLLLRMVMMLYAAALLLMNILVCRRSCSPSDRSADPLVRRHCHIQHHPPGSCHQIGSGAGWCYYSQVMGLISARDFVTVRRIEVIPLKPHSAALVWRDWYCGWVQYLADGSLAVIIVPCPIKNGVPEQPSVIRGVCPEGGGWIQKTEIGCR